MPWRGSPRGSMLALVRRVGPYELEEQIGRGGFGAVWRARDGRDGREVALKLLEGAWLGPEEQARFVREARALRLVRDPGLVELLDADLGGGRPYLVMSLVPGKSLAAHLAEAGPLALPDALDLAREVATTLSRLHARGVVHRDLKPGNLILTPAGRAVLLDLGLALLLDESARLSRTGELMGTPGYMAPEQAQGRPGELGPACDVYGLGALLHALLTGEAPFAAASPLATLEAVLTREAQPPSRLRPGLSPGLDALVLACLRKRPEERPGLEEVRGELERLARGGARRRSPARRASILAVVVLAAAAGALSWWGLARGDRAPGQAAQEQAAREAVARSRAREGAGDPAGALRELERALQLAPHLEEPWRARTGLRFRLGDLTGARADAERALERWPESPGGLVDRAAVRDRQGDPQGARIDLERALALDARCADAWLARAVMRWQSGDLEGALADVGRAIELQPAQVHPRYVRACLLERHGQALAAERELDRALELDPRHAPSWAARAMLHERGGDVPAALTALDRALELAPGLETALRLRAELRERGGDLPGALADLRALLARHEPASAEAEGLARRVSELEARVGR